LARPAIAVALPPEESLAVVRELTEANFDPYPIAGPDDLAVLLEQRRISVAILDGETDFDVSLELYAILHEGTRDIPALMVVSPASLDRLAATSPNSSVEDEYLTRPFSAESLRWRIEAMCIRSQTVDDGSGPVIQSGAFDTDWGQRASIVAVFNPKGGVGKTTVATNLAAALQLHKGQQVLLVDADTVTGHVTTSLGIEHVRTVADSWRDELEGGDPEALPDIAAAHTTGMRVISMTSSPLTTDLLEAERVGDAINACRRGFDFIIVDLHPSYSKLNRAVFDRADRILVPVTPDVPAIRAAVQLRDVAADLGIRERLAMVVNRANSGVSVGDMERTVGMPALALIRSAGLLFVKAANEGRVVAEMFPKERVSADFDALADRLTGAPTAVPTTSRMPFRLFSRPKEAARTPTALRPGA
jgi:pilus assembly protein CpaE